MPNNTVFEEYDFPLTLSDGETINIYVNVKRIRSIRLKIDADGRALVRAPIEMTRGEVTGFVLKNRRWLEKNRKSVIERKEETSRYNDGKKYLFLGKEYNICSCDGRINKAEILDDVILVSIRGERTTEKVNAVADAFFEKRFYYFILQRVDYYSKLTGLIPREIKIRTMNTRWGSCTVTTGDIRFSKNLMPYHPSLVDYVVLHEICHLRYQNHGKRFKGMLDRYMPDWRERQKKLNGK